MQTYVYNNSTSDVIGFSGYSLVMGDGKSLDISQQNVTSYDATLDWCAAFWSGGCESISSRIFL